MTREISDEKNSDDKFDGLYHASEDQLVHERCVFFSF